MNAGTQDTLAGLSEPWKDSETLEALYHKDNLNQSEMADYFQQQGHEITPSTISYWMGKLEIETSHTSHEIDETGNGTCGTCGGDTPAPNNGMCNECLDEARNSDN